jgi:hypothetical protein
MVLAEIDRALDDEPDRVLTAEALTDQLLHAPRDVDWLAIGYSVEARLRQIQAQADAIVAALRRGSNTSVMEPDLQALRESVRQLQQQLELPGGGAAPPTLETLLAQDPLRDAQVPMRGAAAEPDTADPAAPARRGPLGAPVTRPPTVWTDPRRRARGELLRCARLGREHPRHSRVTTAASRSTRAKTAESSRPAATLLLYLNPGRVDTNSARVTRDGNDRKEAAPAAGGHVPSVVRGQERPRPVPRGREQARADHAGRKRSSWAIVRRPGTKRRSWRSRGRTCGS